MQINIIEIIKQILLDGRMVDGHCFEPKHQIIYNAYTKSNLSFEEFLESCLLEKAPEKEAVQPLYKVINIELSQHKALDFLSKGSADKFKEKLKAYDDDVLKNLLNGWFMHIAIHAKNLKELADKKGQFIAIYRGFLLSLKDK